MKFRYLAGKLLLLGIMFFVGCRMFNDPQIYEPYWKKTQLTLNIQDLDSKVLVRLYGGGMMLLSGLCLFKFKGALLLSVVYVAAAMAGVYNPFLELSSEGTTQIFLQKLMLIAGLLIMTDTESHLLKNKQD